jgi:hypothetical protein
MTAACGGPPNTEAPDAAPVDTADAAPSLMPSFGPTDGTLAVGFDATLNGHGTAVMDVSIANDVGTVQLEGDATPAPIVLWSSSAFPGYMLYHGIAVTPSRWSVFFFYCSGTKLVDVYWENSDQQSSALRSEALTGTCSEGGISENVHVQFPAASLVVRPNVPGFTVTGPDIDLEPDGVGTITLGANPLAFTPFGFVDCTNCEMGQSWYELHGILYDAATARACFGILYLFSQPSRDIFVDYSITLPDLSDPALGSGVLTGTWSKP